VARRGSRTWRLSERWLGRRPQWTAGGAAWPGIPSRRQCSALFFRKQSRWLGRRR
jgi:hypothetical protein